jgi:transcription antitermination factor NusG
MLSWHVDVGNTRTHGECDSGGEALSIVSQIGEPRSAPLAFDAGVEFAHWYALQTRSRHERVVTHQLQLRGFSSFLPVVTEVHRWSDRRKLIETPLFPSYVFVRLVPTSQARVQVLRTDGVVRFVGQHAEGTPIPDEQIESVRTLLSHRVPCTRQPFVKAGQRVRIHGGALEGVEGFVVSADGQDTLVVSVDAIQRSLAVRIRGYDIEVL